VPKRRAPAKLAAAEKAVATAERARQQASAALVAARQDLAVSRDRSGERARTLVAREGRAEIVTAELRKVVAEGDARAEIAARLERLAEGRAAIESARAAVDAAQRDLDARREELDVLKARRSLLAVRLAQASGSLGIRAPSEGVDARGLELLAGQARAAAERLAADARAAADAAKLAADAAEQERARLHSRLDLEAGTTLVAALAGAEGEVRVYEREIARLEVAQVQLAQLDEEDRRLSARGRLFEQLADDLAERHFLKFLLDDRRRLLSELGSARLREMTNRYRFDDDSFDVIDELNADRKRDVETLSGGETFLASLALALALAEAVTRHGGRLDCFFLDEGFGSLDPESLDLALDGIDKIVRKDRLIALVSHVRGVSESVEDRIELDKDADGMTQVKAGAARG
jgi:exonuclease SbcC